MKGKTNVKNRKEKAIWHVILKAKPKKTFHYQPETHVPLMWPIDVDGNNCPLSHLCHMEGNYASWKKIGTLSQLGQLYNLVTLVT